MKKKNNPSVFTSTHRDLKRQDYILMEINGACKMLTNSKSYIFYGKIFETVLTNCPLIQSTRVELPVGQVTGTSIVLRPLCTGKKKQRKTI